MLDKNTIAGRLSLGYYFVVLEPGTDNAQIDSQFMSYSQAVRRKNKLSNADVMKAKSNGELTTEF